MICEFESGTIIAQVTTVESETKMDTQPEIRGEKFVITLRTSEKQNAERDAFTD